MGPLLTSKVHEILSAAKPTETGSTPVRCSLDLERTTSTVEVARDHWVFEGRCYPFLSSCRERTIYYWTGTDFQPAARYTRSLTKLVPTEWGPPTFEIDGIKMLPTAQISPFADAE